MEGKLYGGVSCEVLDGFRARPAGEQDREAGVPQILPPDGRRPALEERLEVPVDEGLGGQGVPLPTANTSPESS